MGKYLERTAYQQLLNWKKKSNHSTLEVSGARQVGKTYLVNKFADEQYQQKYYVNLLDMSGELFLSRYQVLWEEMKAGKTVENPVLELLCRQYPGFVDSKNTIIIIDEIQESSMIYNRIREFTRYLQSDFIITGSYLGRIINKDFKYSSGDLDYVEIQTLSFEEFLKSLGKYELFESVDLYGGSKQEVYQELGELFKVYAAIGGYPAVILQYFETASIKDCQAELLKIIHLFINESKRYFEDILDDAIYENLFSAISRILVTEKKGFQKDSLSEELQNLVTKDYSSNISKASVNRAMDWLYRSGIIGYAGKVIDCNILDFKAKSRCYYMDLGLATYFLTQIGCSKEDIAGIVSENFVYLNLKSRLAHPQEIALETPAFATLGQFEIDFFVQSIESEKTYAIEVKAGKNNSKTIKELQRLNKVDYILFTKGNTKGGIINNIYTIPIYGISKFSF